jgi:hypothetical protein
MPEIPFYAKQKSPTTNMINSEFDDDEEDPYSYDLI